MIDRHTHQLYLLSHCQVAPPLKVIIDATIARCDKRFTPQEQRFIERIYWRYRDQASNLAQRLGFEAPEAIQPPSRSEREQISQVDIATADLPGQSEERVF